MQYQDLSWSLLPGLAKNVRSIADLEHKEQTCSLVDWVYDDLGVISKQVGVHPAHVLLGYPQPRQRVSLQGIPTHFSHTCHFLLVLRALGLMQNVG